VLTEKRGRKRNVTVVFTKHVGRGWHALDLARPAATNSEPVKLDFESANGEHKLGINASSACRFPLVQAVISGVISLNSY
jgi:hypothetical protein